MDIFEYISEEESLRALISNINKEKTIAIDTEFSRDKTYYPELCLIQFATKDKLGCIDCIAINDLKPFIDCLFSGNRTIIMHSARQDLDALYLFSKERSFNLIDTQISASLVGEKPQIGLKELLYIVLGEEIDKSFTRIDWKKRPLSEPEINYAIEDVKFLIPMWERINERLVKLDRTSWHKEDCERLKKIEPVQNELALFLKLKGLNSLSDKKRDIAFKIIKWRENKARSMNLPRQWIIEDKILVLIAKKGVSKIDDLRSIEKISSSVIKKYGEEIMSAINNYSSPLVKYSDLFSISEKKDFGLIERLTKSRAEELKIDDSVFMTEKEITNLSKGLYSERLKEGWRSKEIKTILQFISKLDNKSA